uniref:Uncharacterized protein n=1 Tax=Cacopsylla melanoneura TaxID=428564 RepID=A0A8D8ZCQ8_9HEMI
MLPQFHFYLEFFFRKKMLEQTCTYPGQQAITQAPSSFFPSYFSSCVPIGRLLALCKQRPSDLQGIWLESSFLLKFQVLEARYLMLYLTLCYPFLVTCKANSLAQYLKFESGRFMFNTPSRKHLFAAILPLPAIW